MRKYPGIVYVLDVIEDAKHVGAGLPDGRYVPARPLPFYTLFGRFKAAWMVFKGDADALQWPGQ
jgi:hypothetical protein